MKGTGCDRTCPVCGKLRGPWSDHSACSKQLQEANHKPRPTGKLRKKARNKIDLSYWSNID